jgi:hypothetical protein
MLFQPPQEELSDDEIAAWTASALRGSSWREPPVAFVECKRGITQQMRQTHLSHRAVAQLSTYHVIADTRAASVVTAFMNGARPEVWVADRYGSTPGA